MTMKLLKITVWLIALLFFVWCGLAWDHVRYCYHWLLPVLKCAS